MYLFFFHESFWSAFLFHRTGDLFSVYFGSTLVVVISSYDLLRETLVKQGEYFSHRHVGGILPVLNKPEGELNF